MQNLSYLSRASRASHTKLAKLMALILLPITTQTACQTVQGIGTGAGAGQTAQYLPTKAQELIAADGFTPRFTKHPSEASSYPIEVDTIEPDLWKSIVDSCTPTNPNAIWDFACHTAGLVYQQGAVHLGIEPNQEQANIFFQRSCALGYDESDGCRQLTYLQLSTKWQNPVSTPKDIYLSPLRRAVKQVHTQNADNPAKEQQIFTDWFATCSRAFYGNTIDKAEWPAIADACAKWGYAKRMGWTAIPLQTEVQTKHAETILGPTNPEDAFKVACQLGYACYPMLGMGGLGARQNTTLQKLYPLLEQSINACDAVLQNILQNMVGSLPAEQTDQQTAQIEKRVWNWALGVSNQNQQNQQNQRVSWQTWESCKNLPEQWNWWSLVSQSEAGQKQTSEMQKTNASALIKAAKTPQVLTDMRQVWDRVCESQETWQTQSRALWAAPVPMEQIEQATVYRLWRVHTSACFAATPTDAHSKALCEAGNTLGCARSSGLGKQSPVWLE